MKVLNPIYGDYSGKLGSVVFNQTRSGTVCRSLGVGRPITNQVQSDNAQYRKLSIRKWNLLTQAQKDTFITYASTSWQPRVISPYKIATGYNVYTSLDYMRYLLGRRYVGCEYQNQRTGMYYMPMQMEASHTESAPVAPNTPSFYVNYGLHTCDPVMQGIDLDAYYYIKFNIAFRSSYPGYLENPDITNLWGYKYTYVLYCSQPKPSIGSVNRNKYDIHLATFPRMSEINNSLNGDVIDLICYKEDVRNNLRSVTQASGFTYLTLCCVDEVGQVYTGSSNKIHTSELWPTL
jgi:hypothetical protein